MSNRCDHNPIKLRTCDIARRGKGGQPQFIQVMCSYLQHCLKNRNKLKAWNQLNPSGRQRRTESLEATIAVLQYLTVKWFQVDTRRCALSSPGASPGTGYLEVPDVRHLARRISETNDWKGKRRLTVGRAYKVFSDLVRAGYIKRSKQIKEQADTGEWTASPKITTFTKKFFVDLGGVALWNRLVKNGKERMAARTKKLRKEGKASLDINLMMKKYLFPGQILSPKKAHQFISKIIKSVPPNPPPKPI